MASYFRLGETFLDPEKDWYSYLRERPFKDGMKSEYILKTEDKRDGEWILGRVSNILSDVFGKQKPLVQYSVRQTLLDLLARFLYWEKSDIHNDKLAMIHRLIDQIQVEGARKNKAGRLMLDRKMHFGKLVDKIAAYMNFGWPNNFSIQMLGHWMQDAYENGQYRHMERAAELGTRAHEIIEFWISNGQTFEYVEEGEEKTFDLGGEEPEVQNAVSAFFDWWDLNDISPAFLEYRVFDIILGYAGTADGFFRKNSTGELVLLDWKTSGFISAEKYQQVAAYGLAAKRMGERYDLGCPVSAQIIRFDKMTAQFEPYTVWDNEMKFEIHAQQWIRTVKSWDYLKNTNRELEAIRGQA